MGSNISLPALDVKPPQTPNLLEDYSRIMQIQQAQGANQLQQGQIQQQQLALQDDQAWRSALHDPNWDGTSDGLIKLGIKNGAGPKSVMSMQQGLTEAATNVAKLGTAQLDLQQKVSDHIADGLDDVSRAAPEKQQAIWSQTKQNALTFITSQKGMNPAVQQALLQKIQQEPDQFPGADQIDTYKAGMRTNNAILANGKTIAETNEKNAQTANVNAEVPGTQAKSVQEQQQAAAGVQGRAMAGNLPYQAAAGGPQSIPAKAFGMETGQKIAVAQAGVAGVPPAFHGVAKVLVPKAVGDAQAIDAKYSETKTATDNTLSLINAARQGNVSAAALVPLQTALNVTTSQGVHRINRTEVDQVSGAGSAYDRAEGFWGKWTAGQPIPPSVLTDTETVIRAYAKGAQSKHTADIRSLNRNYGSTVDPDAVDKAAASEGSGAPGTGNQGSTVKMRAPNGLLKDVPPDQVDHYKALGATVVNE